MTQSVHLSALILAAGKGTRMHSDKPKVLQTLLGEPMLAHVVAALEPCFGKQIWAVIGHNAAAVQQAFAKSDLRFIEQKEQLGTGHALMVALETLQQAKSDRVFVVNGDMPLLRSEHIRAFLDEAQNVHLAIATLKLESSGAYGRIMRQNGKVTGIVEAKDYTTEHGPDSGEINAGLYVFDMAMLEKLLPLLTNANKSGEYYITDLVHLALAKGYEVEGVVCGNDANLLGINNPVELSRSEEMLQALQVERLLESGVIVHAPREVRIGPNVCIEKGAELHGPCTILGHTKIAKGAFIGPYCHICHSTIEEGAVIHPFSHLEDAFVGTMCTVGPYARLRPGAVLQESSHVGNFVELKKTTLGKGAKANHLSYLGDADIAAKVNVGAGTITCNYDGVNKHRTTIKEGAFIGSNSALVAPVTVGENALVGAGSVVTKDVPDNALCIARSRQSNKERRLIVKK